MDLLAGHDEYLEVDPAAVVRGVAWQYGEAGQLPICPYKAVVVVGSDASGLGCSILSSAEAL